MTWDAIRVGGPLEGLKVIEYAEGVAGPMAGRLLADAGADVVKVEPPRGDRTRGWAFAPSEVASGRIFDALNRSKRSVVIDVPRSSEESCPAIDQLLSAADVVIVDAGELELVDRAVKHLHLIVCVISGWGPDGPWAGLPGGELPAQLSSETTSSLGQAGEEPVRLGTDHASIVTGTYAMQGILAAILAFDEVGGQRIDVSLFGSLIHMRSTLWVSLSNPDRWKGFHLDSYVRPPEFGYQTKDSRMICSLGRVQNAVQLITDLNMEFAFTDSRWELLSTDIAAAVGLGDNAAILHDIWDRGLSQWKFREAKAIIERHGGWATEYLDHHAFSIDEHVRTMGVIIPSAGSDGKSFLDIRAPWKFGETPAPPPRPAPALGQHTPQAVRCDRDDYEQT
jgi:crotonobetainyl-CoA:carnitine CoA-transferase CaiB-like acyl-CoA transferase